METEVTFPPNSVVSYEGGGYDGCIWELNYAYIDEKGKFREIFSSGYSGCHSLEDLKEAAISDVYRLDEQVERDRLADTEPIRRLIGLSRWLANNLSAPFEYPLMPKCECCGERFDVIEARGVDPHGVGGIEIDFRGLVCDECWETKYCQDCEVPLRENGTCEYCAKDRDAKD